MYIKKNSFVFSASDLTTYMSSPFASWMEHYVKVSPENAPDKDADDDMTVALQKKGNAHEHAVLQDMINQGLSVVDLSNVDDEAQATLDAMREGVDIIFQAFLYKAPFQGYSDFLVKVVGESELGDYHYEVWDTKLAKNIKPYFMIQLCCYEEMLQEIQGRRSEYVAVVLGNGNHERLRTEDYFYYYEALKESFLEMHNSFDESSRPDPADYSSWGRYETYAKGLLEEADHLSQVATLRRSQIKKLKNVDINTMQNLAESTLSDIPGMNVVTFEKLKKQARIQKSSAGKYVPEFEILIPEEGIRQGLSLLPYGSKLDVFFDIEGFPLEEGGLEYLWGNTYFDDNGERQFKDFWAHSHLEEKQTFKEFIEWVYERWQRDSSMHIYHYANYEIAACRKLMSRYGVCEYEVDQLLRNEVFVDLYKIVKNGMIIGEPKYSIKNVEHLYRDKRKTEVGTGADSVVVYDNWRENPDGDTWETSKILKDIRDYNIDDCDSTQELVVWLRERQKANNIQYLGKTEVVEPEISEEATKLTILRDSLLSAADALRDKDPQQSSLKENFAWLLEFHRREGKPVFWRLFDRLGQADNELLDDLDCLAMCQRTHREAFKPTPRARNLAYEYSFDPNQEFKGARAKSFYVVGWKDDNDKERKVVFIRDESDLKTGLIVLQCKDEPPETITLIPDEYVRPDPIPSAINDVVRRYADKTLNECSIIDFMERRAPRIKGLESGQSIAPSHDPVERLHQVTNAIINLDNSYLPIQGPPGSGKTYTGKHVIAELLKLGKNVGICSNSHKAINNLLIGTAAYCKEKGIEADFVCTKDTDPDLEELEVAILKNNELVNRIDGPCVIGTTAWGFSRDDLVDAFDYLFVDEAGQVSIANLVAISRSAKNLVLLGDQMQLGQPAQGSHPAESGLSTLDYLLHETPTISDDMGVFLGTTYRMHSAVNEFISHAIYEGKLESDPDNDKQIVALPQGYTGPLNKEAGIIYVPVEHEGNTQASIEEVEEIKKLAKQLIGRTFTNKKGSESAIGWKDILIVAPYNHQVNSLQAALGEKARVGSVDKFQGQEAPIVFFSLCVSDASESPRGIDFLFDKHRINVAISRAQTLAIIVGNPALFRTPVSSHLQMQKINVLARIKNS